MKNSLRVLLAERNMSQYDLHKATGLSKTTIGTIYNEKSDKVQIGTIKKIVECLDVSYDDFFKEIEV